MPSKLATCSSLALLALALSGPGCGDRQSSPDTTPSTRSGAPRPALEADAPVLRWFPPKADLVAVAGSLQELLRAAEQLAALAPSLDLSPLGDKPFDAALWAQRGVVDDAPVGLFIQGPTLTAVLPTAEAGKLSAWARENYQGKIETLRHQGNEVFRASYGPAQWTWLEVDGYFVMHIEVAAAAGASAEGDFGWLDAMQSASIGSAYSGTADAQRAFAHRNVGEVWGSATPLSLLGTLVGGTELLACAGLLGQLEGLVFAASLDGQGAQFRASITVAEGASARLRALQSPAASEGMRAQRAGTGVYASLALDLEATGESLRAAQCPELASLVQDPLASVGWSPPPRAAHVAGTQFRPSNFSGNVALEVALRNKRFIAQRLDSVPGRSFFESSMTVQGTRVKRLSIPTMSSLYYHLSDERLVFGTQKSIMEALLRPPGPDAPAASEELLAAGVWPEKLPQLDLLLRQILPQREQRALVAHFLGRMDHAESQVLLKGNRLVLQVELALRPGVTSLW